MPPDARPQPRGMSELTRIGSVYFEPKTAFADIAARPTWLTPLLLSVVVSFVVVYLMGAHIGWERIAAQQIVASPRYAQMTPDQRQNAIAMGGKFGAIISYCIPVLVPVFWLIAAGILMAIVAGILSTPVKFKQVFSVVAWANLPRVIMGILMGVVIFIKNPDDYNVKNPLAFNIGAFLDPLTTSKFLYAIATSLDLFTIWVLLLTAVGLKAAGGKKLSFGGALFAVFLPWALFVLGGASLAAMFS